MAAKPSDHEDDNRPHRVPEMRWHERLLRLLQLASEISSISTSSLYRAASESRLELRRYTAARSTSSICWTTPSSGCHPSAVKRPARNARLSNSVPVQLVACNRCMLNVCQKCK